MGEVASWDASGGDTLLANRRVHIIDDLLGAVLLLAAGTFAIALELTRRQICAVYQLTFALCASWAFFIIGGLVDHHVSDDQLSLALYGSYLSSASYIYIPVLATALISLGFALHLSTCTNCDCCCLVNGNSNSKLASSSSHKPCFEARIRSHGSLYVACFVSLFVAIGTRLNVRLRGSAINPAGGTVHWTMLRSPCYLSVIHISALVLIALKLFLQHADKRAYRDSEHFRRLSHSLSTPAGQAAPATTVEDLMRPPPAKKVPPSPRRSIEGKAIATRSPRSTSSLLSAAAAATILKADATTKATDSSRRAPLHKGPASYSQQQRHENNDGDVSSLISSDSESDEEVLMPSFKSPGATAHQAPLLLQHQQLGVRAHKPAAHQQRPSSGGGSGYASSPPASPVSTASSSSSSSSSSSFSFSSAAAAAAASGNTRQRMRTARPRSSSNVSSTSTNLLSGSSDSEDPALDSSYYSDRLSSAFSSSTSYGLRRRAAAQSLTVSTAPPTREHGEWLECFDPATGSAYYYNQRTGESRWER